MLCFWPVNRIWKSMSTEDINLRINSTCLLFSSFNVACMSKLRCLVVLAWTIFFFLFVIKGILYKLNFFLIFKRMQRNHTVLLNLVHKVLLELSNLKDSRPERSWLFNYTCMSRQIIFTH